MSQAASCCATLSGRHGGDASTATSISSWNFRPTHESPPRPPPSALAGRGTAERRELAYRLDPASCPYTGRPASDLATRSRRGSRRDATVSQSGWARLRQFQARPRKPVDVSCRKSGGGIDPGHRGIPPGDRRGLIAQAAFFASRPWAISVSAICTAFSAAPLRRLSDTHQNDRPCATVGSLRMRLTNTASSPAHSAGVM